MCAGLFTLRAAKPKQHLRPETLAAKRETLKAAKRETLEYCIANPHGETRNPKRSNTEYVTALRGAALTVMDSCVLKSTQECVLKSCICIHYRESIYIYMHAHTRFERSFVCTYIHGGDTRVGQACGKHEFQLSFIDFF